MVKTLASPISKADFLDELLGTLETVLEEGKNQISNSSFKICYTVCRNILRL